ncbi:large ribosomal RNA subunit accumulation protein YCED homolog 2, chloroplastic isoform X2 [Neltuma alba]|uniref:large ribosomal RNA subunit accumulation protein YCED homolog 2, chloroplastic isoform X2 n=1 Tax=Neltuma alba TaxID=207710 RepID=UPI0010A5956B|nr:large ribosomal RNA subunit accumulation protein YCED homolog 2, chloroplastic isoform X2 [Prosopis alba]
MAKSANLAYSLLNSSPHLASPKSKPKSLSILQTCNNAISASSSSNKPKHLHSPLIGKTTRAPRRLVTISTGDGKWHGEWTSDYKLTLQDLQLQDLVEVEEDKKKNAQVLVSLSIQKHASFGLTVDGNIVTSFTRKCSNCSAPYCRQIDAKFKVWILLASRDNQNIQLPDIGGDPSVIYVRPGNEADLDCLIQDTIRLSTPVKDTCSELCEKSEATLQYTGGVNSSIDKRWSRLYELKNGRL